MAETSLRLNVTACALVQSLYPDTADSTYSSRTNATVGTNSAGRETRLLIKYDAIPSSVQFKRIVGFQIHFFAKQYSAGGATGYFITETIGNFTPGTVTWNTMPSSIERTSRDLLNVYSSSYAEKTAPNDYYAPEGAYIARATALSLQLAKSTGTTAQIILATQYDTNNAPYIDFRYDDSDTVKSQVYQQNSPTGGYVDRTQAQTFAWYLEHESGKYCAGTFAQSSGTFYWRQGTSGDFTAVNAGTAQNVTIPANTFPSGTIQWYISVTDNAGTTSTTPIYTVNTADALTSAFPQSPVETIVDGSAPLVFSWTTSNNYGSPPTGADLQYSTDGINWTGFGSVSGPATTYTAAANALPSGSIFWRVRALNLDAVAGPWSAAVSIANVAAPPAPSVTSDAKPFSTINWSATGQQAYEVWIDGKSYGVQFGTQKTFKLTDYLADGTHSVSVRVQNEYGLWSAFGITNFTVSNTPGSAVTLTLSEGVDAALSWETSDSTADFYIYRDGVKIGHTTGTSFTDRFALGTHTWTVLNKLTSGNYTMSNSVTGTLNTGSSLIAAAAGGAWLSLRLTEMSAGQQTFNRSRNFSLRHIAGAVFPVLELSAFEGKIGHYDAAFADPTEAQTFEALFGRVVVLKSRRGNVVIGLLGQLDKREEDFYTTFSFSVQQIHWEDYVDDANA